MAKPSTREDFRKFILRRLGEPVIQVNVAKKQQEDIIDDALQYFHEFIYDGLVRHFLAHEVTQADIDNNYIDVPEYMLGVTRVFPFRGTGGNTDSILNAPLRFTLADIRHTLGIYDGMRQLDMDNYVISLQYTQMVEDLINGIREYEHSYIQGRLTLFAPLDTLTNVGEFILLDGYRTVEPDDYPRVWNHIFLKKYAYSLMKKQWGENLKKFGGMQLPGGVELNGKEIFDEAVEELRELEEDATYKWSEPPHFFTG